MNFKFNQAPLPKIKSGGEEEEEEEEEEEKAQPFSNIGIQSDKKSQSPPRSQSPNLRDAQINSQNNGDRLAKRVFTGDNPILISRADDQNELIDIEGKATPKRLAKEVCIESRL